MSGPARQRPGMARWRKLMLVAVAAALLAGCDLATGTVRTATELEEAGIRNPNLQYDGGTATLEYDADPNPLEARAGHRPWRLHVGAPGCIARVSKEEERCQLLWLA